jgi:hypothetical protein
MSALAIRGLSKLLYRGAKRMGSFLKKRKANGKGFTKRKLQRTKRKTRRTSRHKKWKTKRKSRRNKRKFNYKQDNAIGDNPDYAHIGANVGRPAKKRKVISKLLRQNVSKTTYQLTNFGSWSRGSGRLMLASNQKSGPGTYMEVPLHLWELNAGIQARGGTTSYPVIFYKCGFSSEVAASVVSWRAAISSSLPVDAVTSTDHSRITVAPGFNYSVVDADASSENLDPGFLGGVGARGYISGVKMKMILNSPQQRSCKWVIQLVQLHEDVTPGIQSTEATAFWQAMTKPYAYSPISDGIRAAQKKYIKILKTMTIIQEAPESDEDHLTARMKHVDIMYHLNRTMNFKWGENTDKIDMVTEDQPIVTNNSAYTTHVHAKARMYMMIRTLCEFSAGTSGVPVDPSNILYPSYDYNMKFYHKSLEDV